MTTTFKAASEKQVAFITKLVGEKALSPEVAQVVETSMELSAKDELSVRSASQLIDYLMNQPRKSNAAGVAPNAPEGMHKVGDQIFKVQVAVHGSGNKYAKELIRNEDGEWSFAYAPGAIRRLGEDTKMTLEEAKAFGALYGTCCVCGRTLTDEVSIENGIGPVCGKRF